MKKLLSFLILFCFLFACDNADSSQKDESLSGKVTAKITVEKTKFLPTESVTFNGDTSVFVDGAVQAKVYEWAVVNEAGENVDFTNNGSSITLTETKAGKYQASLIVKQANLTSQVAKKTIYRMAKQVR